MAFPGEFVTTDAAGRVWVLLLNGVGVGGVCVDGTPQLSSQIGDRRKDAIGDDFALDLAKPQLDLVEPAGVGGSEVEPDTGILLQELPHQPGFVGRAIVEDAVDLLIKLTQGDHLAKRHNKVPARMASCGLAVPAASGRVQGRVEGRRSMTVIFECVALSAAR